MRKALILGTCSSSLYSLDRHIVSCPKILAAMWCSQHANSLGMLYITAASSISRKASLDLLCKDIVNKVVTQLVVIMKQLFEHSAA